MNIEKGNLLHLFVEDSVSAFYSSQLPDNHLAFNQENHLAPVDSSSIYEVNVHKEKQNQDSEQKVGAEAEEDTQKSEDTEEDESTEEVEIIEVDPNVEMIEQAAATGEEPENEGGEGVSHPHDPNEGDVFDIDFDLDSEPPLVAVFLDAELINQFYQETIAEDSFLTPQTNNSPIITGTDTFHSIGNTLLDVSNNMVQNFSQFFSFQQQLQPLKMELLDDNLSHHPHLHHRDPFDVPAVNIVGSVLANDQGLGLMVTGVNNVTKGAFLQMEADGTFKYLPPPGLSDTTDSFEYIVQDLNGNMTVGKVNIVLSDTVWFVDNTNIQTGDLGLGTALDPFTSLNIFLGNDRPDNPGDTIFLRTGIGLYQSGDGMDDFELLIGQNLVGEGAPLVIDDILIRSQGVAPTLENNDFLSTLADISGINLIPRSTIPLVPEFSEPTIEFV